MPLRLRRATEERRARWPAPETRDETPLSWLPAPAHFGHGAPSARARGGRGMGVAPKPGPIHPQRPLLLRFRLYRCLRWWARLLSFLARGSGYIEESFLFSAAAAPGEEAAASDEAARAICRKRQRARRPPGRPPTPALARNWAPMPPMLRCEEALLLLLLEVLLDGSSARADFPDGLTQLRLGVAELPAPVPETDLRRLALRLRSTAVFGARPGSHSRGGSDCGALHARSPVGLAVPHPILRD